MKGHVIRLRIRCRGAVQGVGFRPTVHRIATASGLAGWVVNDPGGATVEIEGPAAVVVAFPERLRAALPPLARLDAMEVAEVPVVGEAAFAVRDSREGRRAGALVPPDAALCHDCRRELDDPADRRHRYPFTTCTNCGPRFSLVHHLPYDRPATSMACFPMCPACDREYTDPADRRFHAEPICCPDCGPRLRFLDPTGAELEAGAGAIQAARRALLDGAVVAVKGLGGFQLACRADRGTPVQTLRARKRRPTKPFAVMVRGLDEAEQLVRLTDADRLVMRSPRSPVVLAPRLPGCAVADDVTPGIDDLGVMLPTTPLHVELLRPAEMPPLVMTSANLSEEPICRENREALARLAGIADAFLVHDRDVVRRIDDSVVRSCSDGPVVVRRARGWVPEPLPLPEAAPAPILAVGGHLQATACVAVGAQAFLSQHCGDLDSEAARGFHREVIAGLEDFLEVEPAVIACDPHPDYFTTWLAREIAEARGGRVIEVQHHLAHAAAVLAEHGRFPEVGEETLAISLDGTGWGPDGTAWGGEWLRLAGDLSWQRVAHLEPLPLVGGERAVREPWRVAVAALARAGAADVIPELPLARSVDPDLAAGVARLAASDAAWPLASGAGRLFEAAGALLGPVVRNDWEGEAAVVLESRAASWPGEAEVWPLAILEPGGPPLLPTVGLLVEAARRLVAGEPVERVAASFHATFCALAVELTRRVGRGMTVALGGGCLVNRLLRNGLRVGLIDAGFEPLLATSVPPGDGG
ncbi:MAG: carbamoyltransferase HypF, partial [Holophagae bacterium]